MTRQAINHRGPEFGAAYADTVRVLKTLFGTENELYIISGSGSAGMEAAVANFARDKKIASLVNGKFGDRFAKIGQRYGTVVTLESEWGTPLDLAALDRELDAGAEIVTMVHNETSAGIRNPAPEVAKLARKYDALFIMDGITSIGGDDVRMDEWGVDIAVVGSQKCLAAPAGLAAIAVGERAWDRISEKRPFYLDMAAYRKSGRGTPMETPYTPAVPLFLALHEACKMIEEEGVPARIARHCRMADAVRAAAKGWGVDLFRRLDAQPPYSNTATAMRIPDAV
jgi:aspartate aminotransferase-like enzyme